MSMKFDEEFNIRIKEANNVIDDYLPSDKGYISRLTDAMNYSVKAGGKRLRPILIESFFRLFKGQGDSYRPFMAAMEMLHTYSLVHDDLPAIDNDGLRRGLLTTHVKYGEALGVLAGDGLLHQSFETAVSAFDLCNGQYTNVINALRIFGNKSGIHGMLGGQSVDVMNSNNTIERNKLDYIYKMKTSALIEGSMMIGASLAGAAQTDIDLIEQSGSDIGLAFQIMDDILDETSTEEKLGKPINSDARNEKTTYVTLEGIQKSMMDINELSESACHKLKNLSFEVDEKELEFIIMLIKKLTVRDR